MVGQCLCHPLPYHIESTRDHPSYTAHACNYHIDMNTLVCLDTKPRWKNSILQFKTSEEIGVENDETAQNHRTWTSQLEPKILTTLFTLNME